MITQAQIEAAEQGVPIRIRGNVELVLVRAEIYDRLAHLLDDPTETYAAVLEALGDEDPDQYLEYLHEAQ